MRKKPEQSLRVRALQYLARREYCRAELHSKLRAYVQTDDECVVEQPSVLDALLDDLTTCGWLSDERAATQLLHAKRSRFGIQRIAHELRQRGIPENLIDDAMPQLKETELEAAREVWRKKFGVLAQDENEKAKQARFMQSRGFSMDIVFKVLRMYDAEN